MRHSCRLAFFRIVNAFTRSPPQAQASAVPAMRDPSSSKGLSRYTVVLLALFAVSAGYAVSVQQHFSIDGSYNFVKLLQMKAFTFPQFSRHHAHYVVQAPVVALMNAGVRDPVVLSWAFGIGLYLPLIASAALCAKVAQRADPRFVLFPLLSLFGVAANYTFMIISESHVTAALFWPLLFLLLLTERFDKRGAVLALGLALLFIRTHESVAILGTILVAVLGLRARERWRQATPLTRTVWVLMLPILLAGVVVAVHFSLHPLSPENRADFFASSGRVLGHWPALMSLGFIATIGLFFLLPGLASSVAGRVATAMLAVAAVVVGLSPLVAPGALRPGLHYATRSLLIVMVPALAVLAVLVIRGHLKGTAATWRRAGLLIAILAIAQTTWLVLACRQWDSFRRVFRQELSSYRGAVPFEQTALANERIGFKVVAPMAWAWTQPTLSILWAPNRQVRTVILNPVSWSGWQPFDPLDPSALPRLEEFGYSTAPYRDSLKP